MLKRILEYINGVGAAIVAGKFKYLLSMDMKTQMTIFSVLNVLKNNGQPEMTFANVTKVKKGHATMLTKAGGTAKHSSIFARYKINAIIRTFSSVVFDEVKGLFVPVLDVWNDDLGSVTLEALAAMSDDDQKKVLGGITIKPDTVILSNGDVTYPDDCSDESLRGVPVKGFYQEDGNFIIDQEKGLDTLQDEYLSDLSYVQKAYGVRASTISKMGVKGGASYAFLPSPSTVKDEKGNEWEITKATKYVVINTDPDGNILDPSAVDIDVFEKTYQEVTEEALAQKFA